MNRLNQIAITRHTIHPKLTANVPVQDDMTSTSSSSSSSSSSLESNSSSPRRQHASAVGFDTVQVRVFNLIAGDHPDVRNGGPPLSLGWDYVEHDAMTIHAYEEQRHQLRIEEEAASDELPRLYGVPRRWTSGQRRDILRINFDVSLEDIEKAEAEVERTKKQREQTNKQPKYKVFAKTEEILHSATRKLSLKGALQRRRQELELLVAMEHAAPAVDQAAKRNKRDLMKASPPSSTSSTSSWSSSSSSSFSMVHLPPPMPAFQLQIGRVISV